MDVLFFVSKLFFFFRAGHVFMNMAVLLFAVYCLKCPAASRPIQRFTFRPGSEFTGKITEFHGHTFY